MTVDDQLSQLGLSRETLLSTIIPGADCLLAGQSGPLPEGFATHRMNEILLELREKYSIILIHGPPVRESADLELLAGYASGIIFVLPDRGEIAPEAKELVNGLTEAGAPILGAVTVRGESA